MTTYNLHKRLLALLPSPPLLYGTVQAVDGPAVIIQLPDGATLRAHGEATLGDTVFVRNGVIEGPAPALPVEQIEV